MPRYFEQSRLVGTDGIVRVPGGISRRSLLKWGAAAGGALAIGGGLAACSSSGSSNGSSGDSGGPRIGFTHPAAQSGIVAVLARYATERMQELGGEFTVGALPNATPEEQFNLIEGWISQRYDAIEVFPLDPTSLAPLQQRAQADGIKWITYLTPMEGDDGTIGPDPTEQGTLLAEGFLEWVNSTGLGTKALVLDFSPLPATGPRVQLAAQACEEQTDIVIVSTQDSVDPASAQEITENTLRAHPDLDVVLCLTDDAAVGAVTAFTNTGKDPATCFIGGCDGTQEALEALLGGTAYKASSAIDVRQFGYDLAGRASRLVEEGGSLGDPTPATLLTADDPETVREFLSRFTED